MKRKAENVGDSKAYFVSLGERELAEVSTSVPKLPVPPENSVRQ